MADYSAPELKVAPPGPRALKVLEKDKSFVSPSYTRDLPFVLDRGEDLWVWDVDGNRYLDFTSGVAVNNCGHSHPEIVKVIREQAGRFAHMAGTDFYYPELADLSEKLAQVAPGNSPKRVFLTNSGTETVEAAIKLARYATGRPRFIGFIGGFHGRTMGSLAFSASKSLHRKGFAPLLSDVTHVPYPDPNGDLVRTTDEAIRYIEKTVFKRLAPPEDVAAVLVEPIQGEGGYIVPPEGFLTKLHEFLKSHGILMIVDEIQSGFGRTGRFFACDHEGVEPDVLLSAKAIANGIPMGALISRADLQNWPPGAHANTFGGNPIACAVSLKVIELLQGGLIENAAKTGKLLGERLAEVAGKREDLVEARGRGLMQAIEFKDADRRNKMVHACFERGMLVLACGDSCIRFIPSLTVTPAHIDTAIGILEAALDGR